MVLLLFKIQFGLFCVILTFIGVLFVYLPKKTFSQAEKRALSTIKPFNIEDWWSKQYTKNIDRYIEDHFPYRDTWIKTSTAFKQMQGIQDEQVAFVDPVHISKKHENKNTILTPKNNLEKIKKHDKKDSLKKSQQDVSLPDDNIQAEDIIYKNGILIYNNMALQFFGGNENMAKYFSKTMNEYHKVLSPNKVNVYCIVPPSSAAFYMPQKYRKGTPEKDNLEIIRENLLQEVNMPDVYGVLEEHKSEYIYFNTNHHWTGLGAYYAYQVFCESANIEPVPLENMQRKVIPKFLGSLYYLLQDSRLKKGIDSVVYYKISTPYQMHVFTGEGYKQKTKSPLYAEYARGGASYGVFLGADHRFLEINTDLNNGKKAIVLKNSYGNPFIPYLAQHYEKIIAIDYRYYEGNGVKKLVKEHGITDVILVTTSVFANVRWHSDRLKIVLHQ